MQNNVVENNKTNIEKGLKEATGMGQRGNGYQEML